MPTELYRTWNYRFIVPPGFVGFVGETIIERRSREYVYEGTFHDRFVPFALATNLETIHDARHIIFRAPGIQEQPFGLRPSIHDALNQVLSELSTTASKALFPPKKTFIWLGDEGDTIAFDHPSGVYIHQRLFEGEHSPLSWTAIRKQALRRSYLRYRLTSKNRKTLDDSISRQSIEWRADELLETFAPLETLTDESLSKVAIIPEIDQFLTDPQVPFSGALGRFNRGGRLGHFDTAWGWRRTTVDGDWLRSLMEAAGLKAAVDGIGCTRFRPKGKALCEAWSRRPLPVLDIALEIIDVGDEAITLAVNVTPGNAAAYLPSTLKLELANGDSIEASPNSAQQIPHSSFPVRLSKEDALFEIPTPAEPFPHYNNQTDTPWRWMLNSVFGLIGAVGGNFSLAAQFAGRPLYASSPRLYPSIVLGNNYLGAGLSSSWNFGPYTQALSRSHNIGTGVIGSYTRDEDDDWLPAASGWMGYRWSTKISQWDFLRGYGFSSRINAGISKRDGLEPFFAYSAAGLLVEKLSPSTAFAARLRYNRVTGREKETLGFPLGSRDRGIRGISLGLYKVPQRWLGTLELRNVLSRGYHDLFGLFSLNQLRGTLFTDVAHIVERGAAEGCPEWVGSVGMGLQWLGDMVGVAPGALTLDLGFPVRSCDDTTFEVYLGFVPPLLAF